jgi:hypothetical protein
MVTAFRLHSGLQTHFRTFDTGFICASAIRYYISSPILDVDMEAIFIFVTAASEKRNLPGLGLAKILPLP